MDLLDFGSGLFRTGCVLGIFVYLLWLGGRRSTPTRRGWYFILCGFGTILLGDLLDIVDEFESLSHFFIVGDTDTHDILEKVIAYPLGYGLLLIGLIRWMPTIQQLSREIDRRKQAEQVLEARVAERTADLTTEVAVRRQTQEALEVARSRLQHLLTAGRAVIYSCEAEGSYTTTFISDNVSTQMGYQPQDFIEDPGFWIDHVHPQDRGRILTDLQTLFQHGEHSHEYRFRHRDGSYRWMRDELRLVRDTQARPLEIVGCGIDITERKQAEQTRNRLSAILEATSDFVGFSDLEGRVLYVNQAGCQMLGITAEEAVGQPVTTFSPAWANAIIRNEGLPEAGRCGKWQGETALLGRDGCEISVSQLILVHRTPDGEVEFFSTIARDISERKRYEAQLEHQANYDSLTELPNRNLLKDRLEHAIAHAQRARLKVAVLFLDLDRFKMVNDSLGHDVGDALLKAVAERLRGCVRAEDTVARLGGDEFVLVLEEVHGDEAALVVANKVLTALQIPFTLEGQTFCINTSIGIGLFPSDGETVVSLLKSADTALHWAKGQGRGCIRCYTSEMNAQVVERLALEQALSQALERGEFLLHYQPIVNLQNREVVAVEALLRWRHPQLGIVPPTKFIPLAEELGLMLAIGEWMFRMACIQARAWQDAGLPALTMAVNLSTRQFIQADLTDRVAGILAETGLQPSRFALEITERQILRDVEGAVAVLKTFKAMKVHLSIDDFGTGYSCLSHLKRFPLDRLKIDREFVRDLSTDSDDATIVLAVIALAHSLGLKVVAEGVETEVQFEFLRKHGCDEMQGYYFSHPLPAQELENLLREDRRLPLLESLVA